MPMTGRTKRTSCSTWNAEAAPSRISPAGPERSAHHDAGNLPEPYTDRASSRRTPFLIIAAFACALLPAAAAVRAAEVYKWVDEQGHVHFGDKPPEQGAEKLEIDTHAPAQDPSLEQQRERRDKLLEMYQEERADHDQTAAKAHEEKQKREQNCARAREQLRQTRAAQFLYQKTDDPRNPRVLSDQERAAETARMERQVAEWCG